MRPSGTQDLLRGFGERGYNWETSVQLQHQLLDGLSFSVGYYRRTFGDFQVTQNRRSATIRRSTTTRSASRSPSDPRLPDGGGNQLCGYYDIKPDRCAAWSQNFVTQGRNVRGAEGGLQRLRRDDERPVQAARRSPAASSTGRTRLNTCFVVNSPQELLFCDQRPPFQTQVKFMGVYPFPWYGIQVSGAFQSVPGRKSLATYVATNAEVAPTLGRDLSAGATSTITLPVAPAGSLYEKRWNQFDLRASKIFRFGGTRVLGSLDVFNVFNSDGVLGVNSGYGPLYRLPTSILAPRLFRFAAQVDF